MVIIVKLAMAPALDWTILTGFFLALLQYTGKKLINQKTDAKTIADTDKLQSLEDQLKQVKNALALKK